MLRTKLKSGVTSLSTYLRLTLPVLLRARAWVAHDTLVHGLGLQTALLVTATILAATHAHAHLHHGLHAIGIGVVSRVCVQCAIGLELG